MGYKKMPHRSQCEDAACNAKRRLFMLSLRVLP